MAGVVTGSVTTQVKVTGLPERRGWPSQQELLRLTRTRPGEAVSYQAQPSHAHIHFVGMLETTTISCRSD